MSFRTLQKLVVVSWLVASMNSPARGQEVPADWKTDCVGRTQISFPGGVDIAAMLPEDLLKGMAPLFDSRDWSYKFEDGQKASWANTAPLKISHPLTKKDELEFDDAIDREWQVELNYFPSDEETGKPVPLTRLPGSKVVKAAWKGAYFYTAYFNVNRTVINWNGIVEVGDDIGMEEMAGYFKTLLTGLRARPTYDVPEESGVCLPYAFVRDNNTMRRHVGMTYRLKLHPDITIWLEDASAAKIGEKQDPAKLNARDKAAFFWKQHYLYHRSYKSLWPGGATFRPTTLAGREGVSNFVEIIRPDAETYDYGYLVTVRGEPDAKEDTPDLMLYVVQNSVNARKRSIEPLGKEAFLKMAETIAASVKRRPVEGIPR